MIRINLLGEKVDNTGVYVLQAIAFASILFLTAGTCFVVYDTAQAALDGHQQEAAVLDAQLKKLRERTKRVEDLEKNKNLLHEKLITIARLKAKKNGPVRVLADLTDAIPERAWLTSINQKSGALEFKGTAQDPQTVSLFMRNLEAADYFGTAELSYSRQKMQDGVPTQEFALLVQLRNPLEVAGFKLPDPKSKTAAKASSKPKKKARAASKDKGSVVDDE